MPKSSSPQVVVRTSFPVFGVLGIVFVTLKLLEVGAVAGWSWWWVTAPFWAPTALSLSIMLLAFVFTGLVAAGVFIFTLIKEIRS